MESTGSPDYRPAQRTLGRTMFLRFELVNTFSFTFLAGNIVVLLLLRFEASNFMIGLVQAFPYLAFLFMPLAKGLVPKHGLVKTFGVAWTIRYMVISPIVIAPLVVLWGYQELGIALVFGGFLLFQIMRGFGLVSISPLTQVLSQGADRGAYLSQKNILVYSASLGGGLLIALGLGATAPLERYSIFMGLGMLLGFLACWFIFKIPEPPQGRAAAKTPFWADVRKALSDGVFIKFLVPYGIFMFVGGLGRSFLVVYAKQGFGFGDDTAMFLTVISGLGAITMGWLSRMALDRLGSKPLFIVFNFIFLLSLVPLIVVPAFSGPLSWIYLALVFFMATLGGAGGENSAQAYFYGVCKPEHQFNVGMFYYLVLGVSGSLGSFLGGGILQFLQGQTFTHPGLQWQIFFAVVLGIGILGFILQFRMRAVGAGSVAGAFGSLVSPRELRAMALLQMLDKSSSLKEEVKAIRALERSGSRLAITELVKRLDSPVFTVRNHAIRALERLASHKEVEAALIQQVAEDRFGTSFRAARILGQRGRTKAIPALRATLGSDDYLLQAYSISALGDLGDSHSRLAIESIVATTPWPLVMVHGIGALRAFGSKESIHILVNILKTDDPAPHLRDEVVFGLSGLLGFDEWLYPKYLAFLKNQRHGVELLLDSLDGAGFAPNRSLNSGPSLLYQASDHVVPGLDGDSFVALMNTIHGEGRELGYFEEPWASILFGALDHSRVASYVRYRYFLLAWAVHGYTTAQGEVGVQPSAYVNPA